MSADTTPAFRFHILVAFVLQRPLFYTSGDAPYCVCSGVVRASVNGYQDPERRDTWGIVYETALCQRTLRESV